RRCTSGASPTWSGRSRSRSVTTVAYVTRYAGADGGGAAPFRRGPPQSSALLHSGLVRPVGLGPRLDLFDDGRVGKRRRIAERSMVRDVAEQPAHDLAAAGLRQLGREHDVRGLRDRADLLPDVVAELFELVERAFLAALERHVGNDRLAGLRILAAADRRFGDLRMVDER